MVAFAFGLAWGLLTLSALGYALVTRRVSRHAEFPGRRSFVWTTGLFALAIGAITPLSVLSRLDTFGPVQPLLLILAFATMLSVPVPWVRFALQYTGQRFPTGRRTLFRLAIPVFLTVGIIAANVVIGFLTFELGLQVLPSGTIDLVSGILEYSTAVTAFYLAAILIVGASIIAWASYSFRHLSDEGGILVGIGVVVPWAAAVIPAATQLFTGQPLLFTYHIAVGGIVGAVALWVAIDRYELFRNVPAAGTVARDVTVDAMNDPVLVTDGAGRLIDLNPAAEAAFDTSVESIGQQLSVILGDDLHLDDLLSDAIDTTAITRHGRTFEATASELRGAEGRSLGYSFVFHDITERRQREQRIQVLNRVLRHNLRNDLNAVTGYAELLEDAVSDTKEYAIEIQRLAAGLLSIGEKAREIEEVVSGPREYRKASLEEAIDQAVAQVRETHPDCGVSVSIETEDQPVNGPVLTSVLGELIENACRHNDADEPRVQVETASRDGRHPIAIRVADNGPGIPDHELAPLQEGHETALQHGSGLGLWLIDWGVATLGGRIRFASNEPRGTVATLGLPADG